MIRFDRAALLLLFLALPANADTVRFDNGQWFDGAGFVTGPRWVTDGFFSPPVGTPDRVVDLDGAWVTPPLADAHTHAMSDTPDPAAEAVRSVASGILFIKNPNSTAAGVTRGRKAIRESGAPLRALYAGSGLTSPGGHPSQIYEAHGASDGWLAVDSESSLDEAWARLLEAEPDLIKVYLEDAANHASIAQDEAFRGKRGLDPALLPSVVERARAAGKPVSAHVRTAEDFRFAVEAGVDEINHLPLEEIATELAARCAEQGVRVVTTVLSHRPSSGVTDPQALHRLNLTRLRDAGVELALGTDNGQVDVIDELVAVHELGALPAPELLRIATTASVRACVAGDAAIGELTPGQEATFLVLEQDPVADPRAFRRIGAIYFRGDAIHTPAEPERRALTASLIPVIMSEGMDAAIARYHEWRRDTPDDYDFSESQLNDLGYAMLGHGAAEGAVRILQLNTEQYPQSVNAWDSLAEAQTAAGDLAGARASSEEVLRRLADLHDVEANFRALLEKTARSRIAAAP